MKKLVFTAVLLIISGTVWTLYLEHRDKRFADNLSKGATTVKQPANTSDAPVVESKNSETVPVDSMSVETIAENARVWHEHAGPHPQSQADTQQAPIGAQAGGNPAQNAADSNPVPPEVIADSKRDLEWWRAIKKWEAKDEALHAEWKKLSQEFDELIGSDRAGFEALIQKVQEDPSYRDQLASKMKVWMAKVEALEEKDKELKKERPIRPTPTHTH